MRLRFKASQAQRAALRAHLARLQQPRVLTEILRSLVPPDVALRQIDCTLASRHPDRFVLRVQVRANAGAPRVFAIKVYSDDFCQQVWAHTRALAAHHRCDAGALCVPIRFVRDERALVFPWVEGVFLSDIVDDRKRDLLRRAALVSASLHQLPIVPEPPTTPQMILDDTMARCERLRSRWPMTGPTIEPLAAQLQDAFAALDTAEPALIHGDLAAGQFLWTGEQLVLLDFDLFGYSDPAYDAGHFLAQLERRCLLDRTLPPHSKEWLACYREAYLAAAPQVSPRNVSFYQGLHLIRKIYTVCRHHPEDGPYLIPPMAARASAALRVKTAVGGVR